MASRWASLGDVDAKAWAELIAAICDADGTGEYYSAEDLAEELEEDGVDVQADTIAVLDGAQLVAYGQLRLPSAPVDGAAVVLMKGGVHPDHRGRGIGRELFTRQESAAIARAAGLHPSLPVRLTAESLVTDAGHVALLEHRGYQPVRYFHAMHYAVTVSDAAHPLDPRVRPYDPALSETLRLAHITAFAAHWGSAPPSPVEWNQRWVGSRPFRAQHSFVMSSEPGGRVDGYLLSYQFEPDEIYVGQLGVVPSARRRGLARAALLAVFASASRAGIGRVALDVDSDNTEGAGALYTTVGFRTVRTSAMYRPSDVSQRIT